MCDYCGHRFYPPGTAIKDKYAHKLQSSDFYDHKVPCATHRTLLLACALVATGDAARLMRLQVHQASILRTALDVRTGDAVRCVTQRKRERERENREINFTSHTFKADLGELQFLSFFLLHIACVFFFRVFRFIILFLCLAISGSPFNGPLRISWPKIMWTLAGVASRPLATVSSRDFATADGSWNFIPALETAECVKGAWDKAVRLVLTANHRLYAGWVLHNYCCF